MKTLQLLICAILLAAVTGCEKNLDLQEDENPFENELLEISEAHFYLKSGESIYRDTAGNKYYSFNFNPDTLQHIYTVYFEEGKKYYLTVSGENAYPVEMHLINSAMDTLFYGETVDIPIMKKYIVWESTVTDTMFVSVVYPEDINFHTYHLQLTFEELTITTLNWNNLILECSGDWFVNADNDLTLACHNSSYIKWVRILDNSLFNYDFSFSVSLKSGIPDIYTGVAIYAADEMIDMFNIPDGCYEFKIVGPVSWEVWTWFGDGLGRYWGETSVSLARGEGAWNSIRITTENDSVNTYVNDELVNEFRNLNFLDNGLYITVEDSKDDTVYFRNAQLIK